MQQKIYLLTVGLLIIFANNVLALTTSCSSNGVTALATSTDLAYAYAFPNPFDSGSGHSTITFTNLATTCTIKIFSITGELVKTIQESDGDGEATWDTTTDSGGRTVSGIYWYLIKSTNDKKTGKLAIIR